MYVKKLFPDARLPERNNPTDSGADVFVYRFEQFYGIDEVITDAAMMPNWKRLQLRPMERVLVNCGIAVTYGQGYEIQVRPRSGNALKRGLTVLNTPGTIDETYRGMVGVIVVNVGSQPQWIEVGEKIAQLVVCPVVSSTIIEVSDLDQTVRNDKGFGSSGT